MGFTEIYERIKLVTNCRTQVELAELLNIRQSSISDAKRRDSVPGDWYMKLFERFGSHLLGYPVLLAVVFAVMYLLLRVLRRRTAVPAGK